MMDTQISSAAKEIVSAKNNTIALTGAGISVASGIPPFRGGGGLWDKYDPAEYATIEAFRKNPAKVWVMLKELTEVIHQSKPNPAHLALAKLEQLGYLRTIITQNVDGLHQEAGNTNVIEFHGSNREVVCLRCEKRYSSKEINLDTLPPHCPCGGILKPDVVLFGEPIPWEALTRSHEEAYSCEVVLVIGTSAVVQPAASIPYLARHTGARIIEVNPEKALSADIFLRGPAEEIMPLLVDEVIRISS